MLQLIKDINGKVIETPIANVIGIKSVYGEIQLGTSINIGGFRAIIQDFSNTDVVEVIPTPLAFGLNNKLDMVTIEISY